MPSCSTAWARVNAFNGGQQSWCAKTEAGFLWGENVVQNMLIRNALRGIKSLLHYHKTPTV